MCEYCEKEKYILNVFLSQCKIKFFKRKNKEKIYVLEINNNYIEINYCPICGRKLN